MVKNLPAMQETLVRSLGWQDPLGKGMATHSSILAWEILWRSLVGYSAWGRRVGHDWATNTFTLPRYNPWEMELGPVYTCSPVLTLNKAGPSWHTKVFVQWVKEFQSLSRVPEKSLPWGTSEIRSQKDSTFPTPSVYLSQHDLPDSRMVPWTQLLIVCSFVGCSERETG